MIRSAYPEEAPKAESQAVEDREKAFRSNILFLAGVVVLMFLAFHLHKEMEIIYVSALFAVVLMPSVDWICTLSVAGRKPNRTVAILLILTTTLLVLAGVFFIGVPPVLRDAKSFMKELPEKMPILASKVKNFPLADAIGVDSLEGKAKDAGSTAGKYVLGSLPKWLSHIFDILAAVFLCIYFMIEGDHAYNFFLSMFPVAKRRRLDTTLKKAEVKMSKWLLGQGILMLAIGVSSLVVFGFLHVRYFILLAVMMGLFNLIPIAGAVFTVALAAGVAALDSWGKMAGVLIFYLIYVNIENAVLTPRIMRSSVNLMGLTVLVALLLGTALAGVVGALVAVPTAALVSVLLEEYAVQH